MYDNLIELLEECKRRGLNDREITSTMKRYLDAKARHAGFPMRGSFELTPCCNLDCKMCYVHLTPQQLRNEKNGVLSGEQWIDIIQQASDMGMFEATLTGGEALLHPDFDKIFLFMEEKNIYINLKTNGLLLTPERVAFLKKHNVYGIQITLYGCDEDSYERVTGHRGFEIVMSAIKRVKEAEIPLELIVTPSRYIEPDLEKLLRLVDSLDVPYSVNPGLVDPLEETGRKSINHDMTLENYIELDRIRAELKGIRLEPVCEGDIPDAGGNSKERRCGLRCAAGRSVFSVSWRGMLHPCRLLERIGYDLTKLSFAEAWRNVNRESEDYPFPSECTGCKYEGICPPCAVQHESGAEIGHVNPKLCERARRLAVEGFIVRRNGG